jgi:hypothetical protein
MVNRGFVAIVVGKVLAPQQKRNDHHHHVEGGTDRVVQAQSRQVREPVVTLVAVGCDGQEHTTDQQCKQAQPNARPWEEAWSGERRRRRDLLAATGRQRDAGSYLDQHDRADDQRRCRRNEELVQRRQERQRDSHDPRRGQKQVAGDDRPYQSLLKREFPKQQQDDQRPEQKDDI